MDIEIRNIASDGFEAAVEVITSAFLDRPDTARIAAYLRDHWVAERAWVAFDRSRACGTFNSWPTDLTVPGGATVPAAAVTAVTVLPTHRRRGVLTAMTATAHAAIRERGEAVGILHSAVPHLRTLRARAGDQDGNADAGRPAHGLPRATNHRRGAGGPRCVRPGRGSGGLRGVAGPPCRRDPAPAVLVGRAPRPGGGALGRALEGLPRAAP